MKLSNQSRLYFLLGAAVTLAFTAVPLLAQSAPASQNETQSSIAQPDEPQDFRPIVGPWKYDIRRRPNPLTGSDKWVDLNGTGVCYKIWDGGSQIDTLEVEGPAGHIEGLTLRLYNPQSHRWRLYWA